MIFLRFSYCSYMSGSLYSFLSIAQRPRSIPLMMSLQSLDLSRYVSIVDDSRIFTLFLLRFLTGSLPCHDRLPVNPLGGKRHLSFYHFMPFRHRFGKPIEKVRYDYFILTGVTHRFLKIFPLYPFFRNTFACFIPQ